MAQACCLPLNKQQQQYKIECIISTFTERERERREREREISKVVITQLALPHTDSYVAMMLLTLKALDYFCINHGEQRFFSI